MLVSGRRDRSIHRRSLSVSAALVVLFVGAGLVYGYLQARGDSPAPQRALVREYCLECHNSVDLTADLSFDHADFDHVGRKPDVWEKVIRKLRAGMMPPADRPQPRAEQRAALDFLARTASGPRGGRPIRTPARRSCAG